VPDKADPLAGPLLEKESLDIGVVTAIAGPAAFEVTFEGEGGHAGGLMMADRWGSEPGRMERPLYSLGIWEWWWWWWWWWAPGGGGGGQQA
jgi:hypothetical protein